MKRLFHIIPVILTGLFAILVLFCLGSTSAVTAMTVKSLEADTLQLNRIVKINPYWIEIIPPAAGVQYYRDGIVFLADTKSESKMLENHTSFGKIEAYYATIGDTLSRNNVLFSPSVPWEVPTDAMTFSRDYSTMFYTKPASGKQNAKIYQARYKADKKGKYEWVSDDKPLSFCNDKSVYSHPALSADDEKMIFASNKKESIGGLDLFISYREGNDWSKPVSLGNQINTPGNETTPFLDKDNNLFFSSDGLKGFGGYDIYMCRYNGRDWDKPVNLSRIINTSDDDLAFTIDPVNGKSAFFTSGSSKGNKQARLYRVTFLDPQSDKRLANLSNAFNYIAHGGFPPKEDTRDIMEETTPVALGTTDTPALTTEAPVKPGTEKLPVDIEAKPPVTATDAIVYRVQFLSLSKPRESNNIKIGGVTYNTFEYFFNGAYRSCAGEFYTPAEALTLQNQMKREGYPDAFIVAFRNNERITGISLSQLAQTGKSSTEQKSGATPQPAKQEQQQTAPAAATGLIYRVQFLTNPNSGGMEQVTIGGITYKTFEYYYQGAYRLCAGEFSNRNQAVELQQAMRRDRYGDAFIVTFRNGSRVTDTGN